MYEAYNCTMYQMLDSKVKMQAFLFYSPYAFAVEN